MTEPKNEKLTRSLNQLIEEHGIRMVLKSLADHCLKEADFLRKDRSTELARNWEDIGQDLKRIVDEQYP